MHSSSLVSKYREKYGLNGLQATACSSGSIPTNNNNVQHTSRIHSTNANMYSAWSCRSPLFIHPSTITWIEKQEKVHRHWAFWLVSLKHIDTKNTTFDVESHRPSWPITNPRVLICRSPRLDPPNTIIIKLRNTITPRERERHHHHGGGGGGLNDDDNNNRWNWCSSSLFIIFACSITWI